VIHEVASEMRTASRVQEDESIAAAKEKEGVQFFELPEADMAQLRQKGNVVHVEYASEINKLYPGDTYRPENYLKEVQEYMGYKAQ
jgi:hypothetical protein